MRQQLADLFKHTSERFPELIYSFEQHEKGHGRIEYRKISVLATTCTGVGFPEVKQIALLHREREVIKTRKKSTEDVYLITNIPFSDLDAEGFAKLKRAYWDIENKLHYRKDFTFGEDRSTIRAGHGPQNMSTLRNFAVGLLTSLGIENIKRCVDNLQHNPVALLQFAQFAEYRLAA